MNTDLFYNLLNKYKCANNYVSSYFVRMAAVEARLTPNEAKEALGVLRQQGKINTDYGVYVVE